MNKKYIALAALLLVLFAGGFAIAAFSGSDKQTATEAEPTEQPGPNEVFMLADRYNPAELNIKVGDTVTFVNKDSEDHWPASDDHPTHQKYSELDPKGLIKPGQSWQFTFDKPGRWEMHDHLFPGTRSVVIVSPN